MARSIRNFAKALIIKDGKMLAVKLKDSEGEWYIMVAAVFLKMFNCTYIIYLYFMQN